MCKTNTNNNSHKSTSLNQPHNPPCSHLKQRNKRSTNSGKRKLRKKLNYQHHQNTNMLYKIIQILLIFMIYFPKKSLHAITNFNQIRFKKDQFYIYKGNKVFLWRRIPVLVRLLLPSMGLPQVSSIKGRLYILRLLKLCPIRNIGS